MMSIDSSPAARRRTNCSRCASEFRGSWETSIVYAPSDASLHDAAIFACPPLSGLMYQVSVGVPPESPPQAANVPDATSAATAPASPRRQPVRGAARPSELSVGRGPLPGAFGTVIASVGMLSSLQSPPSPERGAGHSECQFEPTRPRETAPGPIST